MESSLRRIAQYVLTAITSAKQGMNDFYQEGIDKDREFTDCLIEYPLHDLLTFFSIFPF